MQVTDDEIAAAMRAYWTDTHNLAEGAGAAPLAAALQEKAKLRGKRVGLILTGGNIDFDLFQNDGSDRAYGKWSDRTRAAVTLDVAERI